MSDSLSQIIRRRLLCGWRKPRVPRVDHIGCSLAPRCGSVRSAARATFRRFRRCFFARILVLASASALSACATHPLNPFTSDGAPVVMVPMSYAGVDDRRGRFREIFCSVLQERSDEVPDYMPCEEALTRVGKEPPATGMAVNFGMSTKRLKVFFVPGVGWDCIANWLGLANTVGEHLRKLGYDFSVIEVESLSSSTHNARSVRDALILMTAEDADRGIVLLGYSKGIVDILEAIVSFPEIRPRIAAVVSIAGAVGGTPLANSFEQSSLDLFQSWPGAKCSAGDRGALESLRSVVRQRWLSESELPPEIRYYSLVALPHSDRVSTALWPSYNRLSEIDARNDGQLMFYDQVIPGSGLLGYLNADHWAVAVPISRNRKLAANLIVDKNDFPREALLEATLRIIEEDDP
jgi:hypothetical protein